jgi:hypothetical protein
LGAGCDGRDFAWQTNAQSSDGEAAWSLIFLRKNGQG